MYWDGKAKCESRLAFTLRFFLYIHYLFLRTGREGTLFPPFLLLRFLLLFPDLHFSHNLLQGLDRFRVLTLEPFEIDTFDKLRKRSFPRLQLMVVYLAELVGVQPQFPGYVKLYITRVMGTYKLCKVQATNR